MPVEARRLSGLFLPLILCLSAPTLQAAQTPPAAPAELALTPLLAGEFALQAGRLDEAARHYLAAAQAMNDAMLAERATRIALLANEDKLAAEALRQWQKTGSHTLTQDAVAATLALRQGKRRQALHILRQLLQSESTDAPAQALAALGAAGRGNADAAWVLAQLHQHGDLPMQSLPLMLAFSALAQRLQQPDLQAGLLDAVARAFPDEPRVRLLQAASLRERGDLAAARAMLDALRPQVQGAAEWLLPLAGEYDALGELRVAEAVLAEAPQNLHVQSLRANLLERAEDMTALAALYRQLQARQEEDVPRHRLLLGQVAEALKMHEEALQWYDKVESRELDGFVRLRRATTLHTMGRTAESYAILHALQNSEADEEAVGDPQREAFLLEAELRQKAGEREAELETYARGLAALPDDLAILYAQALAWERFDDIDRAEASLRRILLIEPENVMALNALGYTLADRTTRYREARELIDRARAAEPGNAAIIDSHGWVLYRLGRHEEALVQLRRAFALFKDAEVAAHLGEVLWVLGRQTEARQYFAEAARIDPENRALKRALEKLGITP